MTERIQTTGFYRRKLPHWEVDRRRYFLTIHLAGAIPEAAAARIHEMSRLLRSCAEGEYLSLQRKIFGEMERWLNRADGVRCLAQPKVAAMVAEAIAYREKKHSWKCFEYVIMPNHVHLFVELLHPSLKETLIQFKRWTGHEASKLLGWKGKDFWQREWFDHWSRSDRQDEKIVAYIRHNPVKAGLVKEFGQWPYGSWAK